LDWARRGSEVEQAFVRIVHSAVPSLEVREEPGMRLIRHPLPTPFLNQLAVTARPDEPDRILATARNWFTNPATPWRLTAWEDWQDLLEPACAAGGLRRGESHPVMVLLNRQLGPPRGPEGFRCERVCTTEELAVFDETFHLSNELPQTRFWRADGLLRNPAFQMFVGFLDDRPVATGLGVVAGDLTGVWGIATMPDVRGRGIGAEITRRVADAGRASGAQATYLWATSMGFPVYLRLGFQHVRNQVEWNGGPAPAP
jgi:N-acetylglutamate synthase